ncbi:M20 family metallopeptidase [Moorella sulfitireducens (nom. illeg.)]|uniref:M20 family metallopeptidase n=1 Tax=Neomoorella sulfitireducens TaxID=2972948 RepID=UPI0021AC2A2D|nr:M20 family metallopeptidase [Moorella sulfitireducens]
MEGITLYLNKQLDQMLLLLEKLVNIDSGTGFVEGINRIGGILANELYQIGFESEIYPSPNGNNLVMKKKGKCSASVLLLGHIDTVFPVGTVGKRPFKIQGNRAYGPGVADMKSGLVSIVYALRAIYALKPEMLSNFTILLNVDEEIGSPTSRSLIESIAKISKAVFVLEPARPNGALVIARKGAARYVLKIKGKAAHAGVDPEAGRSAVEELAHKIIRFHKLNNHANDITVNVGTIMGGVAANIVADFAKAEIDVRFRTNDEYLKAKEELNSIVREMHVFGTQSELCEIFYRPPMVCNQVSEGLLEIARQAGLELGLELKATFTGGFSDGNLTAALGVPTIDGMGPVGGGFHSDTEYLDIDTFTERTALLALTLLKITTD